MQNDIDLSSLSKVIDSKKVIDLMFAGKATVTFTSTVTGEHFTYRIDKTPDGARYWVKVLTGSDNENDYTYLGLVYEDQPHVFRFFLSSNSAISWGAPSEKVFRWVIDRLHRPEVLCKVEISHAGYCCRCGRLLTTPEAIANGLGDHCYSLVYSK